MGNYTSASFDENEAIIQLGIEEGRKYYPIFKKMADSLKALYPDYKFIKNRLPAVNSYSLSTIEVEGLNANSKVAFLEQTSLSKSTEITAHKLEKDSREAFAYRTYKSIVYDIKPDGKGGHQLVYHVKPESSVVLKAGISQNTFTGFGVDLNLTARNFISPFSRSMVSINLGQNFRALLEHQQMFGYKTPLSNRFQVYSEFQEVPTYTDFTGTGLYKLKYFTIDDRLQLTAKRKSVGGIGIQWEDIEALPKIQSGTYLNGDNNFFHLYAFWQYNNLSKPQYPKRGTNLELKAGYVFSVSPDFLVYQNDSIVGELNKDLIQYGNYMKTTVNFSNTRPLSRHWALVSRLQGGVNFGSNSSLLNGFIAGGMNQNLHNQVVFAGLKEGEVVSESMLTAHVGARYNPFGKVYATLLGSVMTYDFIKKESLPVSTKWIVGSGLTLAYDLSFGPVELTLMLSNKTHGLRTYFNFGFPFRL